MYFAVPLLVNNPHASASEVGLKLLGACVAASAATACLSAGIISPAMQVRLSKAGGWPFMRGDMVQVMSGHFAGRHGRVVGCYYSQCLVRVVLISEGSYADWTICKGVDVWLLERCNDKIESELT